MPSKKANRAAKEQVRLDYEQAVKQFCIPQGGPEQFRMFCLGITMAVITLKDIAEKPECRFADASLEESAEAYFTAAQQQLHAD